MWTESTQPLVSGGELAMTTYAHVEIICVCMLDALAAMHANEEEIHLKYPLLYHLEFILHRIKDGKKTKKTSLFKKHTNVIRD